MKTRITMLAVVSMFLFLWMGGSVFAAYPHGDFSTSPDACAACHRMHTATALNLIKDPSGGGLCKTCHQNGAGADTDVMNGKYITGSDATPNHAVWGANGGKLLGGGFNYIQSTSTTTSKHRVDETIVPPGSSTGASIAFKCTSCHNAHPDRNHPNQYRLLRVQPNGVASPIDVAWNGPWTTAGATVPAASKSDLTANRAYTEIAYGVGIATDPNAPIEYTRNYNDTNMAVWCAACHTHYMATWTPGAPGTPSAYKSGDVYNAGDTYGNIARERHSVNTPIVNRAAINGITYNLKSDVPLADLTANGRTNDDLLTCLSCHKAHGSDALMSGDSVLENRGSVLPNGVDSMLLRGDRGRRICADCHNI
jgi:predicted CXXCH cytochrome family protein